PVVVALERGPAVERGERPRLVDVVTDRRLDAFGGRVDDAAGVAGAQRVEEPLVQRQVRTPRAGGVLCRALTPAVGGPCGRASPEQLGGDALAAADGEEDEHVRLAGLARLLEVAAADRVVERVPVATDLVERREAVHGRETVHHLVGTPHTVAG